MAFTMCAICEALERLGPDRRSERESCLEAIKPLAQRLQALLVDRLKVYE
jgi:hypothetical protein